MFIFINDFYLYIFLQENALPVISAPMTIEVTEGETITFEVTASDTDEGQLKVTIQQT